jgi:hypothetical protein
MFRGFVTPTPADFDRFTKAFGWTEFPYVGGVSVREPIVGNVYTSTESPPECKIPFHHEMAHVAEYPKVLCAYCDIPAPVGGETPLALSNVVYRLMAERALDFVRRLADEGVCYVRVAPRDNDYGLALGRGWKSTFYADDRSTAEKNAEKAGFKVEWLNDADDSMRYTSSPLAAIRVDSRTGKKIWFNSCYTCYNAWSDVRNDPSKAVLFPNGDPMPADGMKMLDEVMQEVGVSCRWEKGDIAMVDNVLAQHARNYFTPPRRVLISLFKD